MKKTLLAGLLGVALLPVLTALAADAPKSKSMSLKTWFKHLKDGLAQSSVSANYQKNRVTAVAAVRGAAQDTVDPGKPAWKDGMKGKKTQAMKKERAEFSAAVDLILDGKIQEGSAGLDAFEKAHPKSPLMADVNEARAKVKELEAAPEQAAVEAAPEQPAAKP